MADTMAARMPSFTLQPHLLAISHGNAHMQGPLSDLTALVFIFRLCVCVCGSVCVCVCGVISTFFPYFEQLVNQWWTETGVCGESVAELGVSHVNRTRLVPIAARI